MHASLLRKITRKASSRTNKKRYLLIPLNNLLHNFGWCG
nr:MAG TPA: hypothetical protein [Caudoviricetes sp.]